jgi:magnesium transporter
LVFLDFMSKKNKKKAGLPPGTPVFTGEKKTANIDLAFVCFNHETVEEKHFKNQFPPEFASPSDEKVNWYDLKGLDNLSIIEDFGKHFNIHPLVLEDIVNVGQRPKFEEFESGLFIVVTAYAYRNLEMRFHPEQISFYIGKNFLLTFQEDAEELFDGIRQQIFAGKGKIRQKNSDYLAYILIDFIVDQYIETLDIIEEQIEKLESEVISNPTPRVKGNIYHLKRELNLFKKNTISLRDAMQKWSRSETDFSSNHMDIFLRDVLDHLNSCIERSENNREMLTELQGLYLSGMTAKVNGVINVLTIISSIFIPLTFIAGVYGMNFKYMPELEHPWGYPATLSVMVMIALSLLVFFRYRKWI